jgi:hypothetical protein
MKRTFYLLSALTLGLLCSACMTPQGNMNGSSRWGDPATSNSAARTITITPQTQYVNVTGGEVINFVEGDKHFGWMFDGPGAYHFDLALVAPNGSLDHHVIAYVDPDPFYSGGR